MLKRGAPRQKLFTVEEALELYDQLQSYAKVAAALSEKYGDRVTGEAVRKRLKAEGVAPKKKLPLSPMERSRRFALKKKASATS